MNKGFLYGTVLRGEIPSNEEFDKLEEFFGLTPSDGRIHQMIQDKELASLLHVLYTNTVKMSMAAELCDMGNHEFANERGVCFLLN